MLFIFNPYVLLDVLLQNTNQGELLDLDAKADLLEALLQLDQRGMLILRYLEMNRIGFQKILKKLKLN